MGLLTLLDSRQHRWTQMPPPLTRTVRPVAGPRVEQVARRDFVLSTTAELRVMGIERETRVMANEPVTRAVGIDA